MTFPEAPNPVAAGEIYRIRPNLTEKHRQLPGRYVSRPKRELLFDAQFTSLISIQRCNETAIRPS
jgi:hypothetical protein